MMVDPIASETGVSSDLADELDRIHVHGDYELKALSNISEVAPSPFPFIENQEEEHLLNVQANEKNGQSR
jgi:hypothetical protein